jgi:hypothetical protein
MKKALSIFTMTLLILSSCVTGLTDLDISDVEMTIRDKNGIEVDRLLPDTLYSLDFRVTDTAGETYLNPNYQDFSFQKLLRMELVQQARFSVKLKTSLNSFYPPGEPAYGFVLSIKGNPYPARTWSFDLNHSAYDTLDFSGADGEDGESGDRGPAAAGDSADAVRGGSGDSGLDGKPGVDGQDAELVIMEYLHGDRKRLLFYDLGRDLLYLTDRKTITVDTRGGDGGRGGSGGDGGRGTDYYDELADETTSGIIGSPGDGGDGGDAGSGGDITLLAADPLLFNFVRPVTKGGRGGAGGAGGRGSLSDGSPKVGSRGHHGRDGWDGKLRFRTLSRDELGNLLSRISEEGFDPAGVVY